MSNDKQIKSIAVYRFLAALIVLYYHLVQIPTYSLEVINVLKGTLDTPILPDTSFAKLGILMLNKFHFDTGSFAVMMFFIASGFLVSRMMDRYTRSEFLLNRVITIFPTLWVSLIVMAVFVYFSQGIVFTVDDFLASAFPIWPRNSGAFLSAVLWTLRVELKFYLLAAFFGKNRKNLVVYGYMLILLMTIISYEFDMPIVYAQMYDLSYMCFAFVGVILECALREKDRNWLKYVFASVIFNLLLFKISAWLFQDGSSRMSYPNCVTQIAPVVIFVLFLKLEEHYPCVFQRIPGFVYAFAKLVLPYYLTHVTCGIIAMYHFSRAGCNTLVTILGGVLVSIVVAGVIYMLVTKPSGIYMKKVITTMRTKK